VGLVTGFGGRGGNDSVSAFLRVLIRGRGTGRSSLIGRSGSIDASEPLRIVDRFFIGRGGGATGSAFCGGYTKENKTR